jgi:hypothetical protein
MAIVDKLQIKRGNKSKLTTSSLSDGEPCFIEDDTIDGGAIYIGNAKGKYERIPSEFDIDTLKQYIMSLIGEINDLETTNKTLVEAINEVNAKMPVNDTSPRIMWNDTCPSAGTFVAGSIVYKYIPNVSGDYVSLGWSRITTGSNNVLNIDWVEMRVLTGANY